eukprot:gb/GFBE01078786.1/.p1 GENE.gb/GFBE01078786.1/~~gb/GFBE01078786.1/.p1  ORF type:complete len:734 (+),score=127.88 gb/GFBE01078786.1/:1-2202(+)
MDPQLGAASVTSITSSRSVDDYNDQVERKTSVKKVLSMENNIKDLAKAKATVSFQSEASIFQELKHDDSDATMMRGTTVRINGNFINSGGFDSYSAGSQEGATCAAHFSWVRYLLRKTLASPFANSFLGFVILLDVCLSCYDIDENARGNSSPGWLISLSTCCFVVYIVELVAVLVGKGRIALRDGWVQLDIVIIGGGLVDIFVQLVGLGNSGLGVVRVLRLLRVVRLVSMLRKLTFLKELRKLAKMLLSCIKTLLWSFLFCFMCMTFWAMLAVDLVHPLMLELSENGHWSDCAYCSDALSSIMRANLTLFKTIIAGDSWGLIAEPVITQHPWTAFIFMGSLLTIVFGVLNLVVAAVVDEFAEQRVRDVNAIAQEMDENQKEDLKFLAQVFRKIDEDGSGELSLEELMDGARKVPEFRSRLRVMDIDEDDLQQLFHMLDEDKSGAIAPDEFMGALSRWLNESKTAARFVKYNVMKSMQTQSDIMNLMRQRLDRIDKQLRFVWQAQKSMTQDVLQLKEDISDVHSNVGSDVGLDEHIPSQHSFRSSYSGPTSPEARMPPAGLKPSWSAYTGLRSPADHTQGLKVIKAEMEAELASGWNKSFSDDALGHAALPMTLLESIEMASKGAHNTLRASLQAARLALEESSKAQRHRESSAGGQEELLSSLQRTVEALSYPSPVPRDAGGDARGIRWAGHEDDRPPALSGRFSDPKSDASLSSPDGWRADDDSFDHHVVV